MLKWICAVALGVMVTSPAWAQDEKASGPDRPARQTTQFDTTAMKEGNATLKLSGSCKAQYVVSAKGKAKSISVDCTHPEMAQYVVRTIETGVWEPEIFDGYYFDTDPRNQIFNYGSGPPAVDPRGEKGPVLQTGVEQKAINRAIIKIDQPGTCDVKFTVGADGKPKDIAPNCTPEAYNVPIGEAIGAMVFVPGQKGGAPTDWPGMSMPLNLTKPNG